MVSLLLEKGASLNDKDSYGFTALMHAAQNGHTAITTLLLNYGADVNVDLVSKKFHITSSLLYLIV